MLCVVILELFYCVILVWFFSESYNFFGTWVRQVFVMSSKKKVIFISNMQKLITFNIRHLPKKPNTRSSLSSQVGSDIVPVDGVGRISFGHCLYHASPFCLVTCILFHQSIFLHLILKFQLAARCNY